MSHGKEKRGAQPPTLQRRTNHDLPEEIVLEILAKQPVKSLLRFRCVCKRWYSSMANPSFISTHLSNNHHNQGLVIHLAKNTRIPSSGRLDSQFCTLARDRTFETISKFPIPFTFRSWFLVLAGSCNGILCFSDYMTPGCNAVYLWNPSIRMFKRLPYTCSTQLRKVALGFGYDSQTNDYKVVKFSWTIAEPMPPPEVEVYSLSSDSWKRIELGISWRPDVVSRNFNITLTFPVVSGHLHWMIEMIEEGDEQEERSTAMILSFDLNSEKFKELPLPDEEGSCFKKGLTSFKEKLALIKFGSGVQPHSMLSCSIWVMREYGVFDSWNELCVLPIQILTDFIGFTKYGALIRKKTWLVSANGVLKSKDKCVLIDPETLHEKEIITQADSQLNVTTYMENLTLLDGANVVSYKEDLLCV